VAPLANILILPTISLAMFLGFIAGLGGMVWLFLGKFLGLTAWLVLKYILIVAEKLSSVPMAALSLKTSQWWWIVLYYAIIILLINKLKLKPQNEK
jgi:hypothetical protein